MTYNELKTKIKKWKPLFLLGELLTHHRRRAILKGIAFINILLIAALVITALHINPFAPYLLPHALTIRGFFLVLLSLQIGLSMLEAYFYSAYGRISDEKLVSFELGFHMYAPASNDATYAFLSSPYGWTIMDRLGVSPQDLRDFLGRRNTVLSSDVLSFPEHAPNDPYSLADYAKLLADTDKQFVDFLLAHNVLGTEFEEAARWIEEMHQEKIVSEKWWQKEALARVPGLAKNWAYGQTYVLDKYGYDLTQEVSLRRTMGRMIYVNDEVHKLEGVLSRARGANAFVVGEDEDERLAIVESLAKRIHDGKVMPVLEHKRMFLINGNLIIEHNSDKGDFEREFSQVLSQAIETGNTILVIAQFPALLESAKNLGVDVVSVLTPFLRSADLQVIGLCDTATFHQDIEPRVDLAQHFEVISMSKKDNSHLMMMLQNEIIPIEQASKAFFTYQALETIIEGTERYYSGLPQADKCRDILFELLPFTAKKHTRIIDKQDVLELIEQKTGIPTGEAKGKEKEALLHLEEVLHERIVGQDEAVKAISLALRRSRSGLSNKEKPIGSFLFLGPTGVGKTETSKALAQVFFAASNPVLRLDMSEYTAEDSMDKLIGSFRSGKTGVLATALREHPYGILLLDEFEKAHPEVLNLFLQILDEGFFSDMKGVRVSARNLIIIATSNAGSEMIFDMTQKGRDINASKDELIQEIIKTHQFKPELINRFDAVVIFHPLGADHLEKVARLQLAKVVSRLKARGYELRVTPELIKTVTERGSNAAFGARPIARAIQEEVEEPVALAVLRGELPVGSKLEIVDNQVKITT
jgi:ATP-dependent Clp protease ATP-binding subunit ClpC